MAVLMRVWAKLEEGVIAFLLALMTLVTFVYVMLNNLYTPFYDLSDWLADKGWQGSSDFCLKIGDFFIGLAQAMTWSTALTKALFAWLIFLGMAYGVRTAGHIGVDVVVRLFNKPLQKVIGIIACLACLLYGLMLCYASYDWVATLYRAGVYAEDLEKVGIKLWAIGAVVPVGFALLTLRFVEVFIRIIRGLQTGLGLADEAGDALKHMMDGEHHQ
ncbi:TRAP transporter small permease [Gallaecimonas kandeliae]|uniref:TRAP transporter small permease n=1 Tax=Gallaecimonas kandeliae TaxID=3029055 RepID=UPI0026490027|nr:TRAP transporter small permease [Gallaecimonas kandeliae]WKE66246.1 TRAP transporter small permease [Gallaecimonas kandeliae]